jgi:two-component system, cell cycle response regulator
MEPSDPDSRRRILVIEDSQSQALRLSLLLQNNGYEPVVAANGRQGLELLVEGGFSIVITDWVMPEMDGPSFCRAVRAREHDRYVYVILATAQVETSSVAAGLEAGADDFMFKPIDAAVLMAHLSTADRILKLERSLIERNREIEKLAITDALTGVYNRRFLVERLAEEHRRCARYGHPLSVLMGDIDHFKAVNDGRGHHAGDAVLRAVAEALVEGTRKGVDWVARFGGEEFVVVLPEIGPEGAVMVAERLRGVVAGTAVDVGGARVAVTISFGAASFDNAAGAEEAAIDALLRSADARLYEAKSRGRNRTVGG